MHFTLTMMALMLLVMMTATEAEAQTTRGESPSGAEGMSGGGGTLIVLNKDEASVSLLNRETGKEVGKIAVGDGPHEVAVSPDGKTAVVCNYGTRTPGNSLSLIDLPTRTVTRTIDLGEYKRPHGILFFADGQRIVVTSEVAKKLLIVDLAKGEVLKAIDTEGELSHMVVLSPDGRRAYVANLGSSSISVIDLESGTFIARIATGEGAEGVDVSPDGKEIWVGNRVANNVTIVDATTLKVVYTMDCATFPIRCKFTPDGRYVLVSCASSGDVVVFDAKKRTLIKRISMELKALEGTKDRLFGDRFGRTADLAAARPGHDAVRTILVAAENDVDESAQGTLAHGGNAGGKKVDVAVEDLDARLRLAGGENPVQQRAQPRNRSSS